VHLNATNENLRDHASGVLLLKGEEHAGSVRTQRFSEEERNHEILH
jgi:hypothetical protein